MQARETAATERQPQNAQPRQRKRTTAASASRVERGVTNVQWNVDCYKRAVERVDGPALQWSVCLHCLHLPQRNETAYRVLRERIACRAWHEMLQMDCYTHAEFVFK